MMFRENQQVQLLSDAEDFVTVDSEPGGNTDCVRYCTRFHMELRYRMDGTMDLRRVNYTLVDKQHVRRLPMYMYLGMIESYDRRPVSHVFIVILRLDDMGVGSSRALTLGAARDDVVEQTHVECDVNQTPGSGSVQGHRSASTQVQYSGRHRIKLYSRH